MHIEKYVFVKKNLFKWAKHRFAIKSQNQKDSPGVETHTLSGKEKVLGLAVHKEGDTDRLMEHEKTHRC